jgi:hypothetical protein
VGGFENVPFPSVRVWENCEAARTLSLIEKILCVATRDNSLCIRQLTGYFLTAEVRFGFTTITGFLSPIVTSSIATVRSESLEMTIDSSATLVQLS